MKGRRWAAAAVAGLLAAAWEGAAAGAAPPTCTITGFVLAPVGTRGLGLAMGAGAAPCWGPYVFYGVTPQGLGFPARTSDNVRELAAALRAWSPADGVPPVDRWVDLSAPLRARFEADGVSPVRFLQWINEYDGAGTVGRPVMPPSWPPFLPRGLVATPRAAVTGRAPAVPPAPAPASPAPAPRPAPGAPAPSGPPQRPPVAVRAAGRTVPCADLPACALRLQSWDRFRGRPWYARVLLTARWHPGGLAAAGAGLAAALGAGGAALAAGRRRRNRLWYGRSRGPV